MVWYGPKAFAGPLVTLGSSASLPTLQSNDILELQPDGELFAYRPSTGGSASYSSYGGNIFNASSVFDPQTSTYVNLNGTISLSNATFGDFGVDGSNIVVSGESNGWDFDMRVSYSLSNGNLVWTDTVLVAAPLNGSTSSPTGLAVNSQGTVLTTLPNSAGTDVPVAFHDRGSLSPVIPTFGLPQVPTLIAGGITVDSSGNFVLATVATSLLNGGPGYVAVTPDLSQYSATSSTPSVQNGSPPQPWGITALQGAVIVTVPNQSVVLADGYSDPLVGYTPAQIKHAYGVDQITFTGPSGLVHGDGTGQTIAILDEGFDPTILQDLQHFDKTFGLPDPPSFQQINNSGVSADPGVIPETSLDVEWAHAIAPGAKILLFDFPPVDPTATDPEATYYTNLMAEAAYAAKYPGVTVVSISYGRGELALSQEGWSQTNYDSDFQVPGVTFLVSSGDEGAYGDSRAGDQSTLTPEDPAASPDVVAVGGTTLQNLDAAGDYPGTGNGGEIGWSSGSDSWNPIGGGGGGISTIEPEPNWQKQVVPTSIDPGSGTFHGRAVPDVAWDADPATGFPEYYSTPDDSGNTGWFEEGGTSISTPQWAGLIAIANQERAQVYGAPSLTGYDETLPALYSLPSSDFHDIVYGNNGYPAGTGYDLVTGLGSPVANLLVPALAAYQSQLVVTAQPPSSVTAGQGFGLTVTVEDGFGDKVSSYNGPVTISLGNNPDGGTLGGTLTVTAANGVVTFSGLTLDQAANGYTITATGSSLTKATTSAFNVTPAAASQLVVTQEPPSSVTAGVGFHFTITAEDPYGNVATAFNGSVTAGGVTVTAVNGVAAYYVDVTRAGTGYTITATSGSLTPAVTSAFSVTPAAASQLVITTEPPSSVAAGTGFGLAVTAEDPYGNVASGFTGSVTIALANNPGGSTLGGTLTATAVNGVASFSGLTLNKAGTGYTLKATSGSLTAATTTPINVTSSVSSSATFVGTDTTDQGNWRNAFGADGYDIAADTSGTNPKLPSYATLALNGASTYVWAASTSDVRALQNAANTGRIASTFYA
ncbi:MAG: hypothetical protein WBX00_24265, partial [Isosphaeraceae bacterium]